MKHTGNYKSPGIRDNAEFDFGSPLNVLGSPKESGTTPAKKAICDMSSF